MIEYVKRLAGPFTAAGQTDLPFGFKIFEPTDVFVATSTDPNTSSSMLVYGKDYLVNMNPDQEAVPGGKVVLNAPVAKGQVVVVGSAVAYTQNMQLTNFSRFPPEIINESLDRIVVQIQQLVELTGRTISLPPTSNLTVSEFLDNLFNAAKSAAKSAEEAKKFAQICEEIKQNIFIYSWDIPHVVETINDVENYPFDGYFWVGGHGDPGQYGHDISNRFVKANGSTELRTLGERFSDVVNVKDFGAVGNGVHDDTEAIQAALDKTGAVFLPQGNYLISGTLGVSSNTRVFGAGKDLTKISMSSSVNEVYHTIASANAVSIDARLAKNDTVDTLCSQYVENIVIEDLTIDTNVYARPANSHSDREAGTGLELQRVKNFRITRVKSINAPQHGINVRAGASSFKMGLTYRAKYPSIEGVIEYCETDNEKYDDGITTHDSEQITISHCVTRLSRNLSGENSKPVSNGIEIDDGSRYILVESCVSDGSWCGYQAKGHENTPPAQDVVFVNCLAKNNQFGFIVAGTKVTEISDYTDACRNIAIVNCSIENTYAFKGTSSWTGQGHYVQVNNAKNVVVKNLSVNGQTEVQQNALEGERKVYFRHLGYNENITYENINCLNADNSSANTHLFAFEGDSVLLKLNSINCDGYTAGNLINVVSRTNLDISDVYLRKGSASYACVFCAEDSSTSKISNIYAPASKCAIEDRDGAVYRELVSEVAEAKLTETSVTPLSIVGCLTSSTLDVPADTSVAQVFQLKNTGGKLYNVALISAQVRESTPSSLETLSGTALRFSVRNMSSAGGELQARLKLGHEYLIPEETNALNLGSSYRLWKDIFCASGVISTSDKRAKISIVDLEDALMRAWSKVNFKIFQFKDAFERKGEDARLHVGVIAQQVIEAFKSEGLDATRYGLLCYDKWEDEYEDVEVVDTPEIVDEEGNVTLAKTHVEHRLVTPAGDCYGIRYEEALALECAYLRWELQKIKNNLEAK